MDLQQQASNWLNVQHELVNALESLASDLWRVFWNDKAFEIDAETIARRSNLIERMHELHEYGMHGRWDRRWEDLMLDDEDAIFFVQTLHKFELVAENGGNAEMPLANYVVNCSIARWLHDNNARLLKFGDKPLFGYTVTDLACLSGLDERTIRNLMGKKGNLPSVIIDNRAYVLHDVADAWLCTRNFKETEYIEEEARNIVRQPFTSPMDLEEYVSAMLIKNASDRDINSITLQTFLAKTRSCDQYPAIDEIRSIAKLLDIDAHIFAIALARLQAAERMQFIDESFTNQAATLA